MAVKQHCGKKSKDWRNRIHVCHQLEHEIENGKVKHECDHCSYTWLAEDK